MSFTDLYSEKTFLGRWLKSKPAIITINDIIFTHAGISEAIIDQDLTIHQINKIFYNKILGKKRSEIKKDSIAYLLAGGKGPLWYRGYFKPEKFNEIMLDKILTHFQKKTIVVGHTSHKKILNLFHNKIFAIDSRIKLGKSGMLLIYKNGEFWQGDYQGKLTKF